MLALSDWPCAWRGLWWLGGDVGCIWAVLEQSWAVNSSPKKEEVNEEALVTVATDKLPVVAREHLRAVDVRPERTRCHQMTKRFLWRPDQIKALARVKDAPLKHTQPALEDVQARLQEHHARVNWCVLVGARCHVGA